jgi:ADP-ribose pyrophosphatase YjhB (NUDIX family)
MKPIDRFILLSVLLGLLINLTSSFLDARFPQAGLYLTALLVIAICIWGIFRLSSVALQYFRSGRYSVEVFLLNQNNDLLLIKHPYHRRLLPPGGRLNQWEQPHEAVSRSLLEEAGISEFEFHARFHKIQAPKMINNVVERVPAPYLTQIEHRKQRRDIKFHYDFIYICIFTGNTTKSLASVKEYHPKWMTLQEIKQLDKSSRPFDDAIQIYEDLLKKLKPRSTNTRTY